MKNMKSVYLMMVILIGIILVIADCLILLFFKHQFLQLIVRFGLPGIGFLIVYTLIMGIYAKSFSPSYFQNIDAKETHNRMKKIGGIPLKIILMNILLHFVFLLCVFLPKEFLLLEPAYKNSLFWTTQSMGMLIGAFMYVLSDGLVSKTLMTHKLTQYPRDLIEHRQSLKIVLVPFIITIISLVFAISIMILAISQAGGTQNEMQTSIILIPTLVYFVITSALALQLRKNCKTLYTSVLEQLKNLSSERKDLTKRLTICSIDELGSISGMVNTFCEHMSEGIHEIKEGQDELSVVGNHLEEDATSMAASITQISGASEQVLRKTKGQIDSATTSSRAIQQIADNIIALEESISTQASSMSEASAAVEEMIGNISSIGSVTEKMAAQFKTVGQAAEEGREMQINSGERINQIVEQSRALQEANQIIATIAAQTNLLAMNAAIEAAHAGEAGRGFSVVADEIRKLAENSSKESRKISTELKQIVQTINQIVKDAEVSSNAFTQVANRANETEKLVVEVNNAIHEQKTGAGQVMEALKIMNDTTVGVKEGSHEMTMGNESMLREVKTLESSASEISASMEEMSKSIRSINTGAQDVSKLAASARSSIQKISGIADGFEI